MAERNSTGDRYANALDPTYNYHKTPFTNRQLGIIYGDYVTSITKHEVTVILKKAEALGEDDVAELVHEKYDELICGESFKPKYTIEEAKERLQALTPFKIYWDYE